MQKKIQGNTQNIKIANFDVHIFVSISASVSNFVFVSAFVYDFV